jgi:hypothetical protein
MIIIRITGGLGNQLFQYAAAKCLAEQNQTIVKLDIKSFNEDQLRNFDLYEMNDTFHIASDEEIGVYKAVNSPQRVWQYLKPYPRKTFYKQPFFHYDKSFLRLGPPLYLRGYFQSEKYFAPIQQTIRQCYQLKPERTENVKPLVSELTARNSIALHIRRGDYKNTETAAYHGILPISYYQQAIQLAQQRILNPHFYIFSDDSAWAEKNLDLPNSTIISGVLSHTHFEDLFLMQHCRHNIIANSSFSWWGAWLNRNPDKTVIAPKAWFYKGPQDTQDLLPAGWISL